MPIKCQGPVCRIDHFRVIPIDSRTTDITHFADIFHHDVIANALKTLQNTMNHLWRNNSNVCQYTWCLYSCIKSRFRMVIFQLENGLLCKLFQSFGKYIWKWPFLCNLKAYIHLFSRPKIKVTILKTDDEYVWICLITCIMIWTLLQVEGRECINQWSGQHTDQSTVCTGCQRIRCDHSRYRYIIQVYWSLYYQRKYWHKCCGEHCTLSIQTVLLTNYWFSTRNSNV